MSPLHDPFRKTRTAAGYLIVNSDGDAGRYLWVRRLFSALQACDRALVTGDPKPDDAIAEVLTAAADLVGRAWLTANTDNPDVRRLTTALHNGWRDYRDQDAYHSTATSPHPIPAVTESDVAGLDELLSRVLWTRYRPP